MAPESRKPLEWVKTSLKDLKSFPEEVQREIGYALDRAQAGKKYLHAKPFKGLDGVVEIVSDFDTNTYRALYATKIGDVIYVLHCFQKKSKKGIETPKQQVDLIKQRLNIAIDHYKGGQHAKKK